MANITKPELERGNFIAYADEPGTVVSGGGGGAVFLDADFVKIGSPLVPKFSFNDVKNALDGGKAVFIKWTMDSGTGQINVNYALVIQLVIDEAPDNKLYTVNATDGSNALALSATDPNAPMTDNL